MREMVFVKIIVVVVSFGIVGWMVLAIYTSSCATSDIILEIGDIEMPITRSLFFEVRPQGSSSLSALVQTREALSSESWKLEVSSS